MSTIPAEKIERTRNTPRRRRSTANRRPLWFRAALVTNVGVPVRLGAIAAVILSVGAAFAGVGAVPTDPGHGRFPGCQNTCFANLFFAAFLAHFGAALYHGLVRRDGVFGSMAAW